MKKIVLLLAAVALLAPAAQGASLTKEPEGCQAFNPGQPTCTFTATMDAGSPVSGGIGSGSWVVKVKRPGEKKPIVFKPADPYGGFVEFAYREGDVVSAEALTPGTLMTAGSVQE